MKIYLEIRILKRLLRIVLSLFIVFQINIVCAEEPIIIKHYQTQERYQFGIRVLDLAMSKLGKEYKIISSIKHKRNEARGERDIINGRLDLEFAQTTMQREASMIAVKIPVYSGILGLRLLLIKPANNKTISAVKNIEELTQFVGGHGRHWADLSVYPANNLQVITCTKYELLFTMLIKERFDYFHRGIFEIWDELERYSDDLIIADNVMFFYEHPVYFFIGKHRPDLALQVEQGLNIAMQDGSYKKLFMEYHGELIKKANLKSRTLIPLHNPSIPPNTAKVTTNWWMPKS